MCVKGGGGVLGQTTHQNRSKRPTLKAGRKRPSRNGPQPMFNECATSAFQRQGSDRYYRSLVVATTLCNRTHSGFFDLKHCYQRTSADNISRKFGQKSSPTKSLKDGIPDFHHIQLMGLRGRSGWSLPGFSRLKTYKGVW